MRSPSWGVKPMALGSLLSVKQAALQLFGDDFTETDTNRLYTMIRRGDIAVTEMGNRKFIPAWQVDQLEKRRQFTVELVENAPFDIS